VNGEQVSLKVKGEKNRKAAQVAWHRLMADGPKPKPVPTPVPKHEASVKDVVDAFLLAKRGFIKSQTHYVYSCLMAHVTSAFGTVKAEGLKAAAVSRWLSTLAVGVNTRCDIGSTMASCFKWAEAEGIISGHPLKGLKRPSRQSRGAKAVVTPEAHAKVMEAATPELRLLLTLLHETGARPSELAKMEAHHIDFANGVAMLTDHKTAHHTGKPRLIMLTPKAVELLKAQAEANPTGALLRNARGNAWHKDAIGHAMRRACKEAGVKAIAYGYRHTFATAALVKGVPDATVAALLGHSGTAMLHKHYSHLTSQAQAMREALAVVRG